MAKGRIINKQVCQSGKWSRLKNDSSRLLYLLLIVWADRDGKINADPYLMKGSIFPKIKSWTVGRIQKSIQDLINEELVSCYEIGNGDRIILIERFKDFQIIHPHEAMSIYPNLEDSIKCNDISRTMSPLIELNRIELNKNRNRIELNKNVRTFEQSKVDITLTQTLIDLMKENLPTSNIVKQFMNSEKIQNDWINQCRLMRERDERSVEDIEMLIMWSQKDEFWKSNILSMAKLRKQFDRLLLQAKKSNYSGIREWLKERKRNEENR